MNKELTCVRSFADLASFPVGLPRHPDIRIISKARLAYDREVRLFPCLLVVGALELIAPFSHSRRADTVSSLNLAPFARDVSPVAPDSQATKDPPLSTTPRVLFLKNYSEKEMFREIFVANASFSLREGKQPKREKTCCIYAATKMPGVVLEFIAFRQGNSGYEKCLVLKLSVSSVQFNESTVSETF